jgi:hypothetical protein
VPVPDGLRERLLARLSAERDAWWRRALLRSAGVAAAVFLAVWGAMLWRSYHLPRVDLDAFVQNEKWQARSPEVVQQSFRDRGVKTVVPGKNQFDYQLLTYWDLAEFQGKRVPMLQFARNPNDGDFRPRLAWVYVLSDAQFDLAALKAATDNQQLNSGEYAVRVLDNPDNPHFVYVVVYTGGSLEPFLLNRSRPPAA